MHAGGHVLRAGLQRVKKSGASGGEVESPGAIGAQFVLHQAGGRGKQHVGRDRGDQNHFEISGRYAALSERSLGSLHGEIAAGYALVGEVAFADAGALQDPIVGSLDHLFEVGVA